MMSKNTFAIVLLGGFLSEASLYKGFKQRLMSYSGQSVFVVNTRFFDWPPTVTKLGWFLILNKLDRTVKKAFKGSAGEKITLIGHSQGGILARLYLSNLAFLGRSFCGRDYIKHLIMLGSPHLNQGGIQRGGQMARWIQQQVPNSMFSPQVRYTSVAGKYSYGDPSGSVSARFAHKVYKDISGNGHVWGDGLVPVSAALLPGSEQITLDGVSHHTVFGLPWYGSEGVIDSWWR
jgi:pimeloyl-ACP methyl ester carboxylesterase